MRGGREVGFLWSLDRRLVCKTDGDGYTPRLFDITSNASDVGANLRDVSRISYNGNTTNLSRSGVAGVLSMVSLSTRSKHDGALRPGKDVYPSIECLRVLPVTWSLSFAKTSYLSLRRWVFLHIVTKPFPTNNGPSFSHSPRNPYNSIPQHLNHNPSPLLSPKQALINP